MKKKTLVAVLAAIMTLVQPKPSYAIEFNNSSLVSEGHSKQEDVIVKKFVPFINGIKVEEVNLKGLENLRELHLDRHNLDKLDLSENKNLEYVSLNNVATARGRLESIDLSQNTKLVQIHLKDNKVKEIKLSALEDEVSGLNLHGNNLQILDLSMIAISKNGYVDIENNTTDLQGQYKNGVVTVDLKQIKGLDIDRIMVDDTKDVSYNRQTAVATIKTHGNDNVKLVYRYDTKAQYNYSPKRAFPLIVTANIKLANKPVDQINL